MSSFELLRLSLPDASVETTSLRHVGRRAGHLLGMDDLDATRLSTAVSELGRFTQSCRPLEITYAADREPVEGAALTITFRFDGAADAVAGAHELRAGLGRLMDRVEISDDRISLSKYLPPGPKPDLASVRVEMLRESSADHRAILQSLNEELMHTLDALRERETDLVRVNAELDQTNRGVVALYAELEQRSDEVRNAQRAVFEELADALRPPAPDVEGVTLAVRYIPAQVNSPTGGDLYDWFVMPDGRVHITVVDVRGHGVAGTRDALLVTHAVRTLALEGHSLAVLLERADAILQSSSSEVVATAIVAQIDAATGAAHIAGAGHPPALRIPAAAPATFVEAAGRPIGYEGGGSREVCEIALQPGEALLLYTDGLVEIRRDIVEGLDTLAESATAARELDLGRLLDATLRACTRGGTIDDDTLLLAARWSPSVREQPR